MDENHQVRAGSEPIATEGKLWLPPLSPKDKKKLRRFEKKSFAERTGFKGKTLWNWLNLLGVLAIPLVVVGATIAFGIIQADLAQKQHDSDQAIANQQHAADQQSALDQQRATILQTYIDNIQDLLLNHNLLRAKPGDDVAVLARARTLTALHGLDGLRKGVLLQFLYEAHLIGFLDSKGIRQPPIVDLWRADLSDANLDSADLIGVNLSGAILNFAVLNFADLEGAVLNEAILEGATLFGANLSSAILEYAFLVKANLSGVILNGTDLSEANLSGANLKGAIGVTAEELEKQAYLLKGAMMPDGSKHP